MAAKTETPDEAKARRAEHNRKLVETREAYAPEFRAFLGALDPVQVGVLRENAIIDAADRPVVTNFKCNEPDKDGKSKGPLYGPKVTVPTLRRLLAIDKTPDYRWTRWIFFQAGGGDSGMEESKKHLVDALRKMENGMRAAGATQERIDQERTQRTEAYERIVFSCDEDLIGTQKGLFGWTQDFPGFKGKIDSGEGRYIDVEKAMARANAVFKRLVRVNRMMADRGLLEVSDSPADYPNIGALNDMSLRVERTELAAYTRSDVRIAKWTGGAPDNPDFAGWPSWKKRNTVFADDNLSLVVPLTYAAAVEYGFERWKFTSREGFQRALATLDREAENANIGTMTNAWTDLTRVSGGFNRPTVLGILTFNVPVPAWAGGTRTARAVYSLTRLALVCPAHADVDESEITVIDEEANPRGTTKTTEEIRIMIREEVGRSAQAEFEINYDVYAMVQKAVASVPPGEDAAIMAQLIVAAAEGGAEEANMEARASVQRGTREPVSGSDLDLGVRAAVIRVFQTAIGQSKKAMEDAVSADPNSSAAFAASEVHTAIKEKLGQLTTELAGLREVDRGADVYSTREEADAVIASFSGAVDAFLEWIKENHTSLPDLYRPRPAEKATRRKPSAAAAVAADAGG